MKKKLLFFSALLMLFAVNGYSQVTITAKKITYTRKKPIADHKKKFEITYPKIKAATPALSRKIEAELSYEKAFEFTIREEMGELQWLEIASYDVNYNADNILSMSLMIEGTGAYPSASTKYIVINTATGARVRPADVFANTSGLLARLVKMKDAEIAKTKEERKNDPDISAEDLEDLFKSAEEFHKVSLDEFEIDEGGVLFHHDYGFPHAVQAVQPSGEFFLTWKELTPFIKKGGLLGKFAR
jgi:hypothetical protein